MSSPSLPTQLELSLPKLAGKRTPRFGVIQFPGSNCDQDCVRGLRDDCGYAAEFVWHQTPSLHDFDAIVVPGGFSYGDYLRCGAMARHSPVMRAVSEAAASGLPVIGICNGFQILCEAGLLPGALLRNRSLHFVCAPVTLRVESVDSPFTSQCYAGQLLNMPVAHGEGCYHAEPETLRALEEHHQVLLRYVDPMTGEPTEASNPNGSAANIAGICNAARNVFGLMPHPDRSTHARLGSEDGKLIFAAMAEHMAGLAAKR